jgi:hypothetical protein
VIGFVIFDSVAIALSAAAEIIFAAGRTVSESRVITVRRIVESSSTTKVGFVKMVCTPT